MAERATVILVLGEGVSHRQAAEVLDCAESTVSWRDHEALAVSATEPDPPAGKDPLNWLLLSSKGSADAETAQTVVSWYERRWTIEEYFRVLKTGTRVEDRKLDHADDLRKCLAFDAITACYVFDRERMASRTPRPIRSSTTTKSSSSTSG